MIHYIDKSALVAEIKKRGYYAQTMSDNAINGSMRQFYDGMKQGCIDILSFIDTLEVKEVDLEKIIEQTYYDGSVTDTADMNHVTYENIAKYFFELGLKAQKGEKI